MRRLLGRFALLLPLPLLVVATTWSVDPSHLKADDSYESGVAALLLSGKNVANLVNYKERRLQEKLVPGMARAPQVVVLGSSRTMPINAGFFPGKRFFNHSVSGATVEDQLGVFNLYRRKGLLPGQVVLGLDPWLLNARNGQVRWVDLGTGYKEMASLLASQGGAVESLAFPPLEKGGQGGCAFSPSLGRTLLASYRSYAEFASPAYFRKAVSEAMNKGRAATRYWATDRADLDQPVKMADGSYVYGRNFRERTLAEINRDAAGYLKAGTVYSLGGFDRLDPGALRLLDRFVAYLREQGVTVVLFLPPYHPAVYRGMAADPRYAMVDAAEEAYRRLAERHRLTLVGSFDPGRLGLGENDFYDGMHPKGAAIKKVFAAEAPKVALEGR